MEHLLLRSEVFVELTVARWWRNTTWTSLRLIVDGFLDEFELTELLVVAYLLICSLCGATKVLTEAQIIKEWLLLLPSNERRCATGATLVAMLSGHRVGHVHRVTSDHLRRCTRVSTGLLLLLEDELVDLHLLDELIEVHSQLNFLLWQVGKREIRQTVDSGPAISSLIFYCIAHVVVPGL